MTLTMRQADYDALPDRTRLQFEPVQGHYYRDPAWPGDVFVCESVRPIEWGRFVVEIVRGGGGAER